MKSNRIRLFILAAVLTLLLAAVPVLADAPDPAACPPAPAPQVPWWEINPPAPPRTRTRVVTRQAETIISTWEAYGIGTTLIKKVNVRAQASISSTRVAVIRATGTEVDVTARVKNSSGEVWYAVTLANGTLGYIRSDLLDTRNVTVLNYEYAPAAQQEVQVTPAPVQVVVTPQPAPRETPTPILVYITPTPAPAEPEVTPEVIYIYQEKENG